MNEKARNSKDICPSHFLFGIHCEVKKKVNEEDYI
jgi:hypothetical protein